MTDSRQAVPAATDSCAEKSPAGVPGLHPEWPLIIRLMTTMGTSHHTVPATPPEMGTYCYRVRKGVPDHPTSASPGAGTAGLAQSAALCKVTARGIQSPSAVGATHLLAWRAERIFSLSKCAMERDRWEPLANWHEKDSKTRDRIRTLPSTSLKSAHCSQKPRPFDLLQWQTQPTTLSQHILRP